MNDKHMSTQFDAELSGISTRVLEMGGLVESQVAQSIYALTNFSGETATQVLAQEERVNAMEVEIDRHLGLVDLLLGSQHLGGDLAAEVDQRMDGPRHLRLDHATHFQDACRDAAQLGVELSRHMAIVHVCSITRIGP